MNDSKLAGSTRSAYCRKAVERKFGEIHHRRQWGFNISFWTRPQANGRRCFKVVSVLTLTAALLLSGCASAEMASNAESVKAKEFNAPGQGNAGVYIYRDSFVGKTLKKDVWIDGKCIGETAPDVFFYTEVEGGKNHKVDTESEFSPNALELMFEAGKNYFIRQFIKLGVFVGGAGLEQITEEQGKKDVAKLEMAKPGKCSSSQ